MKSVNTTITLLIVIVLVMLWTSGRAEKLFNVVFGK